MRSGFIHIPFLMTGVIVCALFTQSCFTLDEKYGEVEMFHGRPKPVQTVPRAALGKLPSGTFPSHKVQGILVMDSGADYNGETSLSYMQNMLERYVDRLNFGDVPFHYFIDQSGIIYSGRNPETPAKLHEGDPFLMRSGISNLELMESRLNWRKSPKKPLNGFITIMVLGDYDEILVNEAQEKSLFQLIAVLSHEYNLPHHRIVSLQQLYPDTNNPGFYLNAYLTQDVLKKNIPPSPLQHRFLNSPEEES